MNDFNLKYFLAANSCEGFTSAFTGCYDAKKGWRAYIIKGGPGTGKSSFMKYLAAKADEKNIKLELCPCSSDPDSLDALILPDKKIIILDGTAPHTVDPVYPGICEEILNFGSFWNKKALADNAENIIKLTDKNKALHRAASRYIQAAGQIMTDNLKIADAGTAKEKVDSFALQLCKKYIPKKGGSSSEQVRYLCGTTPKGIVSFANTALAATENHIIIEDRYGIVADSIMQIIRSYALSHGYDIITIKNAFLPTRLIDHIIIPELSLSFLREYEFQHFVSDNRRIHARRFMSAKNLGKSRERIRFNKKAIHELLLGAVTVLNEAKAVHDKLEDYYISAMNFDELTLFANEFAQTLFK